MAFSIAPDGSETLNDNLSDWSVNDFSSTSINIKVSFKDVLQVSQGEERDLVFITLLFDQFADESGIQMPSTQFLYHTIPTQIQEEMKEVVE